MQKFISFIERCLDVCGVEPGLRFFVADKLLKDRAVWGAVQSGDFSAVDVGAFLASPCPPTLTICSDQEQTQIGGMNFMEEHLRLLLVRMSDFFHRWHNDFGHASAKAGLMPIFYAAIVMLNIAYGPWESAAWYHQLVQMAMDLGVACGPDDPHLLKLWPRILMDKGLHFETSKAVVGVEARRRFIANLDSEACVKLKNKKCKPSQWVSFDGAWHTWSQHLHTRGFVLGKLLMHRGDVLAAEDLFAGTGGSFKGEKNETRTKAEGVRNAKAKLAAVKSKFQGNLLSCVQLICDPDVVNGCRMLAHGHKPCWSYFTKVEKELTNPKACSAFSQTWAREGYLPVLKNIFSTRLDTYELSRCGFTADFCGLGAKGLTSRSPEIAYEDGLARTFGLFTQHLVSEHAGSALWWTHGYPGRLAALLDPSKVQAVLKEFEVDCKAFWAAKARLDPPLVRNYFPAPPSD